MHNIKIVFQAYIPKNLGKSLLSYFPNYKLNLLQNKSEFIGKIKEFDRGYQTWLPEPGSSVSSNFFATDDANYHGSNHRSHTSRLRIEMNIDIGKVGNYKLPSEIFRHRYHKNWLGNEFQHSSLSQRVKAYIKRIPFYTDFPGRPSPKDIYFGVCHKEMNLRAQELPIKAYVNSHTNNSITTIDVDKVSANYPYLKRLAPNIDFKLKTIIKKFNNNSCHLSFEGTHDLFPAYELIIQDRVIYSHKPIGKGPGVINLNLQTRFHKSIFL